MKEISFKQVSGEFYPEGLQRLEYISAVDDVRDWGTFLEGRKRNLCIVVLHGHGSYGDQLYTRRDIRENWLPEFLATGASLLTLNLRGNAWMSPSAAEDLHAVVEYFKEKRGVQETIFYSGSMGGTSNLIYAVLYPEDVNGIIALGAASDLASYYQWCCVQSEPILHEIAQAIKTSYGGEPNDVLSIYQRHSVVENTKQLTMPVYFSHGGADKIIPVRQARVLAKKMRNCCNFIYHEVPDGDHDSPLYDKQGLHWVLSHL